MTTYISDNLPQFSIVENLLENIIDRNDDQIEQRDYKNFNIDAFKKYIYEIDWSLAKGNTNVNLQFETYLGLAEKSLDKPVPLKKTSTKKITHMWRRWGHTSEFLLAFINDELEKQS